MSKVIVLGAGMVGSAMAMDLAESGLEVTVADARVMQLDAKHAVQMVVADLSDPDAVKKTVAGFDLVMGALPSRFGLQTLRAVCEAGKKYVDISFMDDNALTLSDVAKEHGATAVADCGVAPGVSNMLCGYAFAQLDECTNIDILVGGLPKERAWPFEYKAGFSPHDVIEEYTRPSRIVEDGKVVVREALSEPELVEFDGVGTLEAFNTDGLRSLADTLPVPFMKEKTLRYPGHIEIMRVFRETGFFSKEPITVGDASVRPLDVTAALLFPKWTFAPGEADVTVLRVIARGQQDGQEKEYRWDLLDRYDAKSGLRSMSRTTAFPACIVGRMLLSGTFPLGPGVYAPETPAQQPGFVAHVLGELDARGVHVVAA